MIKRTEVSGRPALVAYLGAGFEPAESAEGAAFAKVIFTDARGGSVFCARRAPVEPLPGMSVAEVEALARQDERDVYAAAYASAVAEGKEPSAAGSAAREAVGRLREVSKKFNPSQRRKPKGTPDGGQWESERGGIIAYHGTREKYLDAIMEEGLTASRDRRRFDSDDDDPLSLYKGKRGESVFVASKLADAIYYASNRFADVLGRGVVLKLKIPAAKFAQFKRDAYHLVGDPEELGFAGPARRAEFHIPPSWIKDFWLVDEKTLTLKKADEADEADEEAWVVVVLPMPEEPPSRFVETGVGLEHQKLFDPNQPRAPRGSPDGFRVSGRSTPSTATGGRGSRRTRGAMMQS